MTGEPATPTRPMRWLAVCPLAELASSGAVTVPGPDGPIAVFDADGEHYALDDTCSHGRASLAEGWVDDGAVECPAHLARFSLRTGEPLTGPATAAVACHRVEVRDGVVGVLVPDQPTPGQPMPDQPTPDERTPDQPATGEEQS